MKHITIILLCLLILNSIVVAEKRLYPSTYISNGDVCRNGQSCNLSSLTVTNFTVTNINTTNYNVTGNMTVSGDLTVEGNITGTIDADNIVNEHWINETYEIGNQTFAQSVDKEDISLRLETTTNDRSYLYYMESDSHILGFRAWYDGHGGGTYIIDAIDGTGNIIPKLEIDRDDNDIDFFVNEDLNDNNITSVQCIELNSEYICDWDEVNATGSSGGGSNDSHVEGDNIYLYNDTTTMYLNETKLNSTINASIDKRVELSFLENLLNSIYLSIIDWNNIKEDIAYNNMSINLIGNLNATGNVTTENIYIGNSESNHYIYFYDTGSTTGQSFAWIDGSNRFETSTSFKVNGVFTASNTATIAGHIIGNNDIYTTGAGDDLWLGTSTQADADFRAYANGDLFMSGNLNATGNIYVSNISADYGDFSDDVTADTFYGSGAHLTNMNITGVTTLNTTIVTENFTVNDITNTYSVILSGTTIYSNTAYAPLLQLGLNSVATGSYSVAIGLDAEADSTSSVAIGNNAHSVGAEGVAIGSLTYAGYRALAMGYWSSATGTNSIALTNTGTASGDYSIALGNQVTASGDYSLAMGSHAKAEGSNSVSIGKSTNASGDDSFAFGDNVTVEGEHSFGFGEDGISSDDNTFNLHNLDLNVTGNITTEGYIGIGTATPTSELHVIGDVNVIGNTNLAFDTIIGDESGGEYWNFSKFTSSNGFEYSLIGGVSVNNIIDIGVFDYGLNLRASPVLSDSSVLSFVDTFDMGRGYFFTFRNSTEKLELTALKMDKPMLDVLMDLNVTKNISATYYKSQEDNTALSFNSTFNTTSNVWSLTFNIIPGRIVT